MPADSSASLISAATVQGYRGGSQGWRGAHQVHLFGGCVTSWKQASGDEVLYIRPDAKFDGSKPISGGIPHCFPQVQRKDFKNDVFLGPYL